MSDETIHFQGDTIRGDIIQRQMAELTALRARLAQAKAENAVMVEALEFYRDGWLVTTSRQPGLTWRPKEELLDDCGNKAKDTLAALSRHGNPEDQNAR